MNEERPDFILMEHEGLCFVCQQPTRHIELNYQAWLHPGLCEAAADADYFSRL